MVGALLTLLTDWACASDQVAQAVKKVAQRAFDQDATDTLVRLLCSEALRGALVEPKWLQRALAQSFQNLDPCAYQLATDQLAPHSDWLSGFVSHQIFTVCLTEKSAQSRRFLSCMKEHLTQTRQHLSRALAQSTVNRWLGQIEAKVVVPNIEVVGCGSAGASALEMVMSGCCAGVGFMAVDTKSPALDASSAPTKYAIEPTAIAKLRAGLEDGAPTALAELLPNLEQAISCADILLVVTDLGSLTGRLIAPAVASMAKRLGVLTLAVVRAPVPSSGELTGRQRKSLTRLLDHADCILVVSAGESKTACRLQTQRPEPPFGLGEALCHVLKGITEILNEAAMVCCELGDVRIVLEGGRFAAIGVGSAKGEARTCLAAMRSLSSLASSGATIREASGILIQIAGGLDLQGKEVSQAATLIADQASKTANIIFGARCDPSLGPTMRVTILAVGVDGPVACLERSDLP